MPCFESRSGSFGFSEAWPHPAQTALENNENVHVMPLSGHSLLKLHVVAKCYSMHHCTARKYN